MNPLERIPPTARLVIYLLYGVGSVVMAYAQTKKWVGVPEVALWYSLGTVFGLTAASNTPVGKTRKSPALPESNIIPNTTLSKTDDSLF